MVSSELAELGRRVVEGLTILTGENVLGSSGHLSVRLPDGRGFLINPRFPASLAEPEDLCVVSYDGEQLSGRFPMPSETPIHTAIYRSRPDAHSALHCHPRSSVLVGLLDRGFVPIHREAQRFADGVGSLRDSTHIVNDQQAGAMVDVLGRRRAAFLVGHGIVISEESIEHTCVAAIALEQSCEDQLRLMAVSQPVPLVEAAQGTVVVKRFRTNGVAYRNWPYLRHRHRLATKSEIKADIKPATDLP